MIEQIYTQFENQAANIGPLGAKIKFVIDKTPILIDGSGSENIVSQLDSEADCVIICSAETMISLKSGNLNPMMAVMTGKIKIKGDMGLAMKLQSLI
jgi:putative sterol carrier protein